MSQKILRVFAVLAISVFMLPAFAFGQPGFVKAMKAKDKHTPAMFGIAGVVAAGVSVDQNGDAIVKVFTNRANLQNVPVAIDGVKVEYVFSGEFVSFDKIRDQKKDRLADVVAQRPGNGNGNPGGGGGGGGGGVSPQDRFDRPVPIGVSLGSTGANFCYAGTLGCRLKGGVSRYILSNNHVVANENQGTILSDGMLQPGTLDNNCIAGQQADVIGVLSDFEPLNFNGQPNYVDAGIAITDTSDTGVGTPAGEAYGTPTSNVQTASIGMRVVKYGRTTGFTYGKVDSLNVSVNVGYDSGTALFVNQIVIKGTRPNGKGSKTFSAGGDSGSLIVQLDDNDPVGLLFAGNSSFTIANPIGAVLDTFSGNGTTFTIDDGN